MIDAVEALALGIVSDVVAPEQLMSVTQELAKTFADGPPMVIRLSKRAMYKSMESGLRESLEFETWAQSVCSTSADAGEGIRAFVEKRDPTFTGN